jgi:rare lipoprotein A (peptidoglycan hydrolase)
VESFLFYELSEASMRIMTAAIVVAWAALYPASASAQNFDDRWSIIPKAHADQPPPGTRPPSPSPPQQAPADPPSQPQQSAPAADTTVGSSNQPAAPAAKQTFYGRASFYSYAKGKTASGSQFDRNLPTAAHRSLPFGTSLRVTNLTNNKSVVVTVTDRGPHTRGRVLDLSLDAARSLEFGDRGVVEVKAEVL